MLVQQISQESQENDVLTDLEERVLIDDISALPFEALDPTPFTPPGRVMVDCLPSRAGLG